MVNFGQPIEQAVRILGASIVGAGSDEGYSTEQLNEALSEDGICALLCDKSWLCKPEMAPAD